MNGGLLALIITLAIQALVSMASFTLPVMATAVARDIGTSVSLIGVFVALIYLAAMLSSLLSGRWIPRVGAIRVSQACLLLAAAGLGLAAVGTHWSLVLSAMLLGAGYGPVTPASSHVLARSTPAHLMGFMFSVKQTGVPLGGVLAGLLVPRLVDGLGWQAALWTVALLCVVVAAMAQPLRDRLDDDRQADFRASQNPLRPLALIFAHRRMRDLALCSFFFGAMQLCLTTYLVTYLIHGYGVNLVTAGLVLSLAQGGGMAGRLLWGWLGDRWLAPRYLLAGLALAMAGSSLATAAFAPGWPLLAVASVSIFFGATAIGWNGIFLAEVARLAPAGGAGQYTGGTLFFTYFGVVVGPPAFALITGAEDSLALGYAVFGGLLLVVGLMLAHAARRPLTVSGG